MLIYRITLTKFADKLVASGRAARWNPNETEVIYTASSRSLACLENVVHRSQLGLNQLFSVLTIEVPDSVKKEIVKLSDLPQDWREFAQMPLTQSIGENWLNKAQTVILQVPSSIIEEEVNYLINPQHPDFRKIKLINTDKFVFDMRIKTA
ncbi:RES family NAD+ phosphorylase [Mucilaginibacter jinjuensis]|uniref:RES family NAD+ phosphorylase n=1 Tax=Mucilaginibacter jinjuensis TaxID=1176721 RepID=A0ABY7TDX8_9SPHI|nr:RES family NAD+ phosphorylase [Mucilaginibacter jinjuensis]WCT13913.1 RES family NAD+ phosphorylase [Mucilaginibacter jinjuensis]